ncbi:MAG: aldehyde dehydrogenase family protein, partial [Actinotalea sp.]|nr:aldehyde dehydrogenase family protein [Actinotalea sp.]
MQRISHWINGDEWSGATGRTAPVHDPATGQQTGEVLLADAGVVDEAVASAVKAADGWRRASLTQRTR